MILKTIMWQNECIFYQIYPIGFCGAPKSNDGKLVHRLEKLCDWAEYLQALGVGAVLLNPVFESDNHGYDTRDFTRIDCRLGTNDDLRRVCETLHARNIRVVLDGVFNHVGRGFWAFLDVLKNREQSRYRDWFCINFGGNNAYGDNLWYEGWEGHYELVKLNLKNGEVVDYLLQCVKGWIDEFGIDGLRLDVAYCLDREFMRRLRSFCDATKPEFCLIGEMLFGDYNQIVNPSMLHSCTNYECYKGIHSSFNSQNLFEIAHSLNRQFGAEQWTLYKDKHLLSFLDNHDVSRIGSILSNPAHLPLAYGLLFAFPGIPCIYYGSEWGIAGDKRHGDDALRPCPDTPVQNELSELVKKLARIRTQESALSHGNYKNIRIESRQLALERSHAGETVYVFLNAADNSHAFCGLGSYCAIDLLTGTKHTIADTFTLAPYGMAYLKRT